MSHRNPSRLVRSTLAWAAAGLLAACGGSGNGDGGSGIPGPIYGLGVYFASDSDGDFEIYGLEAATGAVVQLTFNTAFDYSPSTTQDGSRIAFTSDRDSPADVFVMNGDGSGQVKLTAATSAATACSQPAISPDGTRIAYTSQGGLGDIDVYIMNADGSNVTRLTTTAGFDGHPCFNHDGTKIAFSSNRVAADNPSGFSRIFVMNADGTNQVRVTNVVGAFGDFQPAFDGLGQKIVFSSTRTPAAEEIFLMNADGSGLVQMTSDGFINYDPTFGPGSYDILFTTNRYAGGEEVASVPVGDGAVTRRTDRAGENGAATSCCTATV